MNKNKMSFFCIGYFDDLINPAETYVLTHSFHLRADVIKWNISLLLTLCEGNPPYASLNWVSIGSDNGLSPIRRQAIILANAGYC